MDYTVKYNGTEVGRFTNWLSAKKWAVEYMGAKSSGKAEIYIGAKKSSELYHEGGKLMYRNVAQGNVEVIGKGGMPVKTVTKSAVAPVKKASVKKPAVAKVPKAKQDVIGYFTIKGESKGYKSLNSARAEAVKRIGIGKTKSGHFTIMKDNVDYGWVNKTYNLGERPQWYELGHEHYRSRPLDVDGGFYVKAPTKKYEPLTKPTHNVKVGDVFVASWGYDQTNIDYFQVVSTTMAGVYVRPIYAKTVDSGYGSDYVVPAKGQWKDYGLIKDTPEGVFKKVQYEGFNTPHIKVKHTWATLWKGGKDYRTSFGFGH